MDFPDVSPWQFVSRKLTSWLLAHVDYELAPHTTPCDCCLASPETWPTPGMASSFVDGYGRQLMLCEDCIPLYMSNADYMGVERLAGGSPVPNKFGMLASVMVVADQNGAVILMPEKIAVKMPPLFPLKKIVYESLADANAHIRTGDWAYPAVFIADLGKKKSELVRNLQFSYSQKKIALCRAEGVSLVNFAAINHCAALAADMDKADVKLAVKLMMDSANGRISPAGLAQAVKDKPAVQSLLNAATTDPYGRIAAAGVLKNV